jgi:DNA modification methylase
MWELYEGDCLEIMRGLPKNSVDLIITDPPFFMPASHYQSRKGWQRKFGDLSPLKVFWTEITKECARLLKPTGHIFVFCNCDSYPVFYEPMYNNFDKLKSIIWDKTRVGLGRIFRNQHELIIWGRWQDHKFNNDNQLRADVLSYPATLSHDRLHPVEKPINLLKELITPTTDEGDTVFDPFAGGGGVAVACEELGRNSILIEIESEYCGIIKSRMKDVISQTKLIDAFTNFL